MAFTAVRVDKEKLAALIKKRWRTKAKAAKALDCPPNTIYGWLDRGTIAPLHFDRLVAICGDEARAIELADSVDDKRGEEDVIWVKVPEDFLEKMKTIAAKEGTTVELLAARLVSEGLAIDNAEAKPSADPKSLRKLEPPRAHEDRTSAAKSQGGTK